MAYNYQRKSFTLIEVLVAVAIIVFIGAVLLKIVSNNTFFISSILQKDSFNSFISLFPDVNKNTKKNSFDIGSLVVNKYPSIDSELKSFLDDKKVEYLDQLVVSKSIFDSNISKSNNSEDAQSDSLDFKVEIRKKIIFTPNESDTNQQREYLYYFIENTN